jgi:hypothetical protein
VLYKHSGEIIIIKKSGMLCHLGKSQSIGGHKVLRQLNSLGINKIKNTHFFVLRKKRAAIVGNKVYSLCNIGKGNFLGKMLRNIIFDVLNEYKMEETCSF